MNTFSNRQSRRRFLKQSGLAAAAAPQILASTILGREGHTAPNDKIAMGFIGLGGQGSGHVFGEAWTYLPGGYLARRDVAIAAACDVIKERREKVRDRINLYNATRYRNSTYQVCEAYNDFRDVLARDDVDAVLIATPVHWHGIQAILAAKAKKDIYDEKPTSATIRETQALVKAVKENNCVFQAGTQQRSEYDARFRIAVEMVRNGRIGTLKEVYACRDGGYVRWPSADAKAVPIPPGLDWDLWLGPAPMVPYQGHHDAHWLAGGGINWGQHHYDIVQWALDADRTGPVELFVDEGHAAYRYANGVTVYGRMYPGESIGETGGAWFIGTEGRIGVDREHLVSHPASILEKPIGPDDKRVYHSDSHSGNFLDCVRSRKPAICDVETAHRAASLMLLGGIVNKLQRPLKWDPAKETFIDDDEANGLLDMKKRHPWTLEDVMKS